MCMLEINMSTDEAEDAPLVCLEEALKCKLSDDSKKMLSQKRLEFLEDFGSSPARYNVFSRLAQSPMIGVGVRTRAHSDAQCQHLAIVS